MLDRVVKLLLCSSKEQLVDIFKKYLLPQPFKILLSKLMMLDILLERAQVPH